MNISKGYLRKVLLQLFLLLHNSYSYIIFLLVHCRNLVFLQEKFVTGWKKKTKYDYLVIRQMIRSVLIEKKWDVVMQVKLTNVCIHVLYRKVVKVCQQLNHFCKHRWLNFISRSTVLMILMQLTVGHQDGKFATTQRKSAWKENLVPMTAQWLKSSSRLCLRWSMSINMVKNNCTLVAKLLPTKLLDVNKSANKYGMEIGK